MRKEERRKIYNRIASMVEVGDIFYTYYNNCLYLIQITNILSRSDEGACEFRELNPNLFINYVKDYYLTNKIDNLKQLLGKSSLKLLDNKEEVKILSDNSKLNDFSNKNNIEKVNNNLLIKMTGSLTKPNHFLFDEQENLCLMLEYGLFEEGILDGQKYHISSLKNDKEAILPRETSILFEVYVPYNFTGSVQKMYDPHLGELNNYYIKIRKDKDIGKGLIYFRKIKSLDSFLKESYHLSTKLLIDCKNLECGFAKPFAFEANTPDTIINKHGDTYPFAYIYNYLNIRAMNYGMSKKIFINEFSKFYQPKISGLNNFSSSEIETLLDNYLIFNLYTGFYSGYDTRKYISNGYYLFDKGFFSIIYKYLSKDNSIERIYQINPKLKQERERFEVFTLSADEFEIVKNIFISSKDLNDFLNQNYNYFKNQLIKTFKKGSILTENIYQRAKEIKELFFNLCSNSNDYYEDENKIYNTIKLSPENGVISFHNNDNELITYQMPNWNKINDNYILNYLIDDYMNFKIFVYSADELDKYKVIDITHYVEKNSPVAIKKINNPLTKLIEALGYLHSIGYEQLRMSIFFAPNGLSLRVVISVKDDFDSITGFVLKDIDHDHVFHYSTSQKFYYFNNQNSYEKSSPIEVANKLLEKYPDLERLGHRLDKEYVKWFQSIIKLAEKEIFPYAYDDNGYSALSFGAIKLTNNKKIKFAPTDSNRIKII